MVYRNKKTGAVVTTTCKVNGANWVEVKPKAAESKTADTEAKPKAAETKNAKGKAKAK